MDASSYLTDTLAGLTAAAFRDVASEDVRPSTSNFYLRGGGTAAPASPAGHEFDGGLWPPLYQPPLHTLEAVGTALPWGSAAFPDIGAFSYGSQVIDAVAGTWHGCGLRYDGTVKCWGYNAYGELGNNSTTNSSSAVSVSSLSTAIALSAGAFHTCALIVDGTVQCWGANWYGQIGNSVWPGSNVPSSAVSGISTAIAIAAGAYHTCALLANGTIRCWGANDYGQLGDGSTTDSYGPSSAVSGISTAVGIAAGGYHTCALLANGTIQCWGYNTSGQTGDGTTYAWYTTPTTPVIGVTTAVAVVASASSAHTCALLGDGSIRCWGNNTWGQLGDGTTDGTSANGHNTPPPATPIASGAVAVAAGNSHTCAILANGTAKCWGCLSSDGSDHCVLTMPELTPVSVSGASGMIRISGGAQFRCATLSTGGAKCWGSNNVGQLGNGNTTDQNTPVSVSNYP